MKQPIGARLAIWLAALAFSFSASAIENGRVVVSTNGYYETWLTALPNEGFAFKEWVGSDVKWTNNPIKVIWAAPTPVFESLAPGFVTLNITSERPEIIVISPKKNAYQKRETVTVGVDLQRGASITRSIRFTGWSGSITSTLTELTLKMDTTLDVHANLDSMEVDQPLMTEPAAGEHPSLPVIGRQGSVYLANQTNLISTTPSLKTEWELETGLVNHTIPTLGQDETIYVAGGNGDAVAVNRSGAILWRFFSGEPAQAIAPLRNRPPPIALAADETLYISPVTSSNVYVVNGGKLLRTIAPLSSGTQRQRRPIIGADRTLYMPTAEGYSAETPEGQVKWTAPYPRPIAIDSAGRLYSMTGAYIIAVDFDGKHRWTQLLAPISDVLLGEGGRVFVATSVGIGCYDADGRLQWFSGTNGRIVPLADGGVLAVKAFKVGFDGFIFIHYTRIFRPRHAWRANDDLSCVE